MNYESMICIWLDDGGAPSIGIDYQPIRDNDYIEDSMTQHIWSLMKIVEANQNFEIILSPKQSLHTTA